MHPRGVFSLQYVFRGWRHGAEGPTISGVPTSMACSLRLATDAAVRLKRALGAPAEAACRADVRRRTRLDPTGAPLQGVSLNAVGGSHVSRFASACLIPALGLALASSLQAQDLGRPFRGIEARFAQLSQTIPGFGGFYFDDEGNLIAYVTDTVHAAAVRTALDSTLRSRPRGLSVRPTSSPRVIVQQGRFAFTQLAAWRDQVIPALVGQIPDIVFVDLDEQRNRVTIAVASEAASSAVLQTVVGLGIPGDAIHVFVRKPIRVRASRPG